MEADPLFLHLHKLPPAVVAEESLAQVLETLWSTRKTGLGSLQKPRIQSLLGLSTLEELDPVLACLRLIMRKYVHEKRTGDDIQKLCPPDLSMELQSILVTLLQKYQDKWREEASRDQSPWQRMRVSNQAKVNAPSALTSFIASELSSPWPRHDGATSYPHVNGPGGSIPNYVDANLPSTAPTPPHLDNGSLDSLVILPRLKSMTWTMENRKSTPANRVAIITLKLQDYTKSPSGEIEVKFQLLKDTLEAMLRSMAYISEQLSNSVKVCHTCGNASWDEFLEICCLCSVVVEHVYCMATMLDEASRGSWLCEECTIAIRWLRRQNHHQRSRGNHGEPDVFSKLAASRTATQTSSLISSPAPSATSINHASMTHIAFDCYEDTDRNPNFLFCFILVGTDIR